MNRHTNITCGEAIGAAGTSENTVSLNLWGGSDEENVQLRIDDIHESLFRESPVQFQDLTEIAAYVYCADQMISRTKQDTDSFGGNWRRDLHFHIPVRMPEIWLRPDVNTALVKLLNFLSDDHYQFSFYQAKEPPKFQSYLGFDQTADPRFAPEQVMLFSGGLDSLAGAVDEILLQKRNVALVTHKSTSKNNKILRQLRNMLTKKAGARPPLCVSVRASKRRDEAREYTQRTRSFLFAAFGVTVARMLGLNNLRFYENGPVSLNLPVCAQVVGGRSTRTTHPRVIAGFQNLFSLLAEEHFTVENPYLWKTKAEVIDVILKAGHPDLIAPSISCAHTWERKLDVTHCGTCSQCIDRRIAIVAANAEAHDSEDQYKHDIFTGSRPKEDDKILTAAYLERANEIENLNSVGAFISKFPTVLRAVQALPGNAEANAQRAFDLYKRHAQEVKRAVRIMLSRNSMAIFERSLPGDSLIRLVYESASVTSLPGVGSDTGPENFFWRRGNVWEARFRSGVSILIQKHRKGCESLQYLLARPYQPLSVYDVVSDLAVDYCDEYLEGKKGKIDPSEIEHGFEVTDGLKRSDLGEIASHEDIQRYKAEVLDLIADLNEAREANDTGRVEKLENDIALIAKAIEEATGLGGRRRKAKDERKNLRDAFRVSVDRTITEIEKDDPNFGHHLRDYVDLGTNVGYRPDKPTSWSIQPRLTERSKKI